MELNHIIPDMEKTFGTLEFAGIGNVEQVYVTGKPPVITRKFHLFSDVQRAEDIIVILPGNVGEKRIEPDTPVTLINPRIAVEGYKIGERGLSKYILLADDMIESKKVESEGKKI